MTTRKPVVVVTRRLPELVETRMRELFDARLNLEDKPMSQAEIVEAMHEADVLVPTITDHINAAMIAQAGEQMRLIAN
ncbi:MAG TPA: D-glycerate dehydrogenase, partial [Roseiarcus sp.]|nr:D-glycerate dehydrogenase [Roseiarcus sp.]